MTLMYTLRALSEPVHCEEGHERRQARGCSRRGTLKRGGEQVLFGALAHAMSQALQARRAAHVSIETRKVMVACQTKRKPNKKEANTGRITAAANTTSDEDDDIEPVSHLIRGFEQDARDQNVKRTIQRQKTRASFVQDDLKQHKSERNRQRHGGGEETVDRVLLIWPPWRPRRFLLDTTRQVPHTRSMPRRLPLVPRPPRPPTYIRSARGDRRTAILSHRAHLHPVGARPRLRAPAKAQGPQHIRPVMAKLPFQTPALIGHIVLSFAIGARLLSLLPIPPTLIYADELTELFAPWRISLCVLYQDLPQSTRYSPVSSCSPSCGPH